MNLSLKIFPCQLYYYYYQLLFVLSYNHKLYWYHYIINFTNGLSHTLGLVVSVASSKIATCLGSKVFSANFTAGFLSSSDSLLSEAAKKFIRG